MNDSLMTYQCQNNASCVLCMILWMMMMNCFALESCYCSRACHLFVILIWKSTNVTLFCNIWQPDTYHIHFRYISFSWTFPSVNQSLNIFMQMYKFDLHVFKLKANIQTFVWSDFLWFIKSKIQQTENVHTASLVNVYSTPSI